MRHQLPTFALVALLLTLPLATSTNLAPNARTTCDARVTLTPTLAVNAPPITHCEAWASEYASPGEADHPLVTTKDGRAIVAFTDGAYGIPTHTTVQAHDEPSGRVLWTSTYTPHYPGAFALQANPTSNLVHVAGVGCVGFLCRIPEAFVLTLDAANGALKWDDHWDWGSIATAITTSPNGNVLYVAGHVHDNYHVTAYDAGSGRILWEASYDNHGGKPSDWAYSSYDEAFSIATSPDASRVFVTGISADTNGTFDDATLALDATTGATLWTAREAATAPTGGAVKNEAFTIRVTPDNARVLVLGTSGLQQLDASTGNVTSRASTPACPMTAPMHAPGECSLALTPDGSRAIVRTPDVVTAISLATAHPAWSFVLHAPRQNEPGNQYMIHAGGMTLSNDAKSVLVTSLSGKEAYVTDNTHQDTETDSLDAATGALEWRSTYHHGSLSMPYGITTSSSGRVFVPIWSTPTVGTTTSIVTLAIDPHTPPILDVPLT